jgi:hypothetical protein
MDDLKPRKTWGGGCAAAVCTRAEKNPGGKPGFLLRCGMIRSGIRVEFTRDRPDEFADDVIE